MLYTDNGDWGKLGPHGKVAPFADYPLWLAAVVPEPSFRKFIPAPWKDVACWQYTFSRRVPGINANVDGDVFFGDLGAWRDIGR